MALTPPTAPTPPTPPVVPRVVLGGGGSVTESTQPVSGTSDNESQARAAVARGDGPLAKTTTEAPQERQTGKHRCQPPACRKGDDKRQDNKNHRSTARPQAMRGEKRQQKTQDREM